MLTEPSRRRSNGTARAARERAVMQAVVGRLGVETIRLAFSDAVRLAASWSLPGSAPASRGRSAVSNLPRTIG